MPTGYTHNVPNMTFKEFALNCSRAFGAMISMRDAPSGAEIPEKIYPDTYYKEAMEEARVELERLKALSPEQVLNEGQLAHTKEQEYSKLRLQEIDDLIGAYRDMLIHVRAWEPPTEDHRGLKNFMIEQLESSIEWDDHTNIHQRESEKKDAAGSELWPQEQIIQAEKDILYYKKEYEKECERVRNQNIWISSLRESLE